MWASSRWDSPCGRTGHPPACGGRGRCCTLGSHPPFAVVADTFQHKHLKPCVGTGTMLPRPVPSPCSLCGTGGSKSCPPSACLLGRNHSKRRQCPLHQGSAPSRRRARGHTLTGRMDSCRGGAGQLWLASLRCQLGGDALAANSITSSPMSPANSQTVPQSSPQQLELAP